MVRADPTRAMPPIGMLDKSLDVRADVENRCRVPPSRKLNLYQRAVQSEVRRRGLDDNGVGVVHAFGEPSGVTVVRVPGAKDLVRDLMAANTRVVQLPTTGRPTETRGRRVACEVKRVAPSNVSVSSGRLRRGSGRVAPPTRDVRGYLETQNPISLLSPIISRGSVGFSLHFRQGVQLFRQHLREETGTRLRHAKRAHA